MSLFQCLNLVLQLIPHANLAQPDVHHENPHSFASCRSHLACRSSFRHRSFLRSRSSWSRSSSILRCSSWRLKAAKRSSTLLTQPSRRFWKLKGYSDIFSLFWFNLYSTWPSSIGKDVTPCLVSISVMISSIARLVVDFVLLLLLACSLGSIWTSNTYAQK